MGQNVCGKLDAPWTLRPAHWSGVSACEKPRQQGSGTHARTSITTRGKLGVRPQQDIDRRRTCRRKTAHERASAYIGVNCKRSFGAK
jgi:hypothetical protein